MPRRSACVVRLYRLRNSATFGNSSGASATSQVWPLIFSAPVSVSSANPPQTNWMHCKKSRGSSPKRGILSIARSTPHM